MAPPPRLTRLFIQEIFGEGSHNIDIPFKVDERVTILHGLNGSGKTITLKLLHAVWEGRYTALLAFPLTVMHLEFDDGSVLELRPERAPQEDNKRGVLVSLIRSRNLPPILRARLLGDATDHAELVIGILRRNNVGAHPVRRNLYRIYQPPGATTQHDLHDLERLYAPLLKNEPSYVNCPTREPEALQRLRTSLAPALLIRADRLLQRQDEHEDSSAGKRVQQLSKRLQVEVAAARQASRQAVSQLEENLVKQLFDLNPDVPSAEALLDQAATLSALEARLREAGLFDEETTALPHQIEEVQRPALHNMLQRREAAFKPLEALFNKVERLLKSLNTKLWPKQIRTDRDWGYQVLTASRRELKVSQLSSGEQHELVLLHELLFELHPGSLILIDEPELSLHVTWQATLLEELLDIAKLVDLHFVLATHSPYIIGAHDDLMVQLGPSASEAP